MKQTIEHPMTTKSKAGIFKQKVCSTQFKDYQMEQHKDEPNNVSEALLSKNWIEIMDDEYKALMRNRTWKLVPPSINQKVIENKWVLKHNIEGKI